MTTEEQLAAANRVIGILRDALSHLPCCVEDMITDAEDRAFYREYMGFDEDDESEEDDEGADCAAL